VWQLDGARGFAALAKSQRILIVAIMAAAGFLIGEGFLYVLAVCGVIRVFTKDAPENGDAKAFIQFAGLLIVLSMLMAIPIARVTDRL
jgi:hypothetical protein